MHLLEKDETLFCHIFLTLKLSWDILHKTAITILYLSREYGSEKLLVYFPSLTLFWFCLCFNITSHEQIENLGELKDLQGKQQCQKCFCLVNRSKLFPFWRPQFWWSLAYNEAKRRSQEVVSLFKKWQKMYLVYWFPLSYLVQTMAELWEPELFWPWQFIIQVGEKEEHC